jgi:hypothetical protein
MSETDRARHPSYRRYTRRYRKKQRIVRDIWIVSGTLMLWVPLSFLLVLAMATTFLAFMILDEVP